MHGLSVVLAAALTVGGCNTKKAEVSAAPVQKATVTKLGGEVAPAAPAQQTLAATAPSAMDSLLTLKGKVTERIDANTYTYLKLQTADGEMWAAVPETKVAVGAEVEITRGARMDGFESKTLKRRFDKIVFGYLGTNKPAGAPPPTASAHGTAEGADTTTAADIAQQHAAVASGPMDAGDVKVPKAEGADAKTVSEIWAQKAKLKDAKVTIRGKVVKVSSAMDKTFLHLRDGTGTAAAKDNDITVTTDGTAQKGDVVIVNGVVHVDVNFGAGYAYPVIIQEAKIKK